MKILGDDKMTSLFGHWDLGLDAVLLSVIIFLLLYRWIILSFQFTLRHIFFFLFFNYFWLHSVIQRQCH